MQTTETVPETDAIRPCCGNCGRALPIPATWTSWEGKCPGCVRVARVTLFPRSYTAIAEGSEGLPRTAEEQAACFVHPDRVAEASCATCGRFVCALCDVGVGKEHFCVTCLEREQLNPSNPMFALQLTRYGFAAMSLFLVPLNLGLFSFLATLPMQASDETMAYMAIGVTVVVGILAWPSALAVLVLGRRPQSGEPGSANSFVGAVLLVVYCLALFLGLGVFVNATAAM